MYIEEYNTARVSGMFSEIGSKKYTYSKREASPQSNKYNNQSPCNAEKKLFNIHIPRRRKARIQQATSEKLLSFLNIEKSLFPFFSKHYMRIYKSIFLTMYEYIFKKKEERYREGEQLKSKTK